MMTEPEKLVAKLNKKEYLVLQEQYFDNQRKHSELSIYEVTARMQISLNIVRLAQDLRLLDRKLKQHYEENNQFIDNEPATVDEMVTGRRLRRLGDHANKVRFDVIHNNS
jgi:hypothetical protein